MKRVVVLVAGALTLSACADVGRQATISTSTAACGLGTGALVTAVTANPIAGIIAGAAVGGSCGYGTTSVFASIDEDERGRRQGVIAAAASGLQVPGETAAWADQDVQGQVVLAEEFALEGQQCRRVHFAAAESRVESSILCRRGPGKDFVWQ